MPKRAILSDDEFLRRKDRPDYGARPDPIHVVDLFCGCGGMTLGLAEAAERARRGLRVPLAVDLDPTAVSIYRRNFPGAVVREADVARLFSPQLLRTTPTRAEKALLEGIERVDFLVGGPPCQGHSDLNNHTRRDDERNDLYLVMARAARLLLPSFVIVENVPAVRHDRRDVVTRTVEVLRASDFEVAHAILDLSAIGIPQRRRRHVLLAAARSLGVDPRVVLDKAVSPTRIQGERDVDWAIKDLERIRPTSDFDRTGTVTAANRARIDWLHDNGVDDLPDELRPPCHQGGGHSYKSV